MIYRLLPPCCTRPPSQHSVLVGLPSLLQASGCFAPQPHSGALGCGAREAGTAHTPRAPQKPRWDCALRSCSACEQIGVPGQPRGHGQPDPRGHGQLDPGGHRQPDPWGHGQVDARGHGQPDPPGTQADRSLSPLTAPVSPLTPPLCPPPCPGPPRAGSCPSPFFTFLSTGA